MMSKLRKFMDNCPDGEERVSIAAWEGDEARVFVFLRWKPALLMYYYVHLHIWH